MQDRLLLQEAVEFIRSIAWANSEVINTQKILIFNQPMKPVSEYEIIVYNPSTATDITVKLFSLENFEGSIKGQEAFIDSWIVPASQTITGTAIDTYKENVSGIFNDSPLKIVLSNDTAIGVAGAFTALLKIKKVRLSLNYEQYNMPDKS